jgi:hypothetical protein
MASGKAPARGGVTKHSVGDRRLHEHHGDEYHAPQHPLGSGATSRGAMQFSPVVVMQCGSWPQDFDSTGLYGILETITNAKKLVRWQNIKPL